MFTITQTVITAGYFIWVGLGQWKKASFGKIWPIFRIPKILNFLKKNPLAEICTLRVLSCCAIYFCPYATPFSVSFVLIYQEIKPLPLSTAMKETVVTKTQSPRSLVWDQRLNVIRF